MDSVKSAVSVNATGVPLGEVGAYGARWAVREKLRLDEIPISIKVRPNSGIGLAEPRRSFTGVLTSDTEHLNPHG